MKKKLICTILILNLVLVPCYHSYADAGTITIAGGTIGVGGVAGGALAGLAGPAVVAVFVGMMAVGIDVELTKQSEQAGLTKTEFVKQKIQEYCNEAGKTTDVFYKGITNGTSVLKDGTIAFSDATATQIKQFINWLFDSNQVNENVSQTEGTVSIAGLNLPLISSVSAKRVGTSSLYTYTTTENCAFVIASDGSVNQLYAIINKTGVMGSRTLGNYTDTYEIRSYLNGYYYADTGIGGARGVYEVTPEIPIYNGTLGSFLNSADGTFDNSSAEPTTDGFTGQRDEWNEKSGVFNPTQGYPTVVNPGLVGQIPIPADTDITVNVREYLDALQEVLDKLKDRVIEGVDNADGIPKDWDIPDAVEVNPTIGKQPPIPDSDRTPVSNDDPVDPSKTPTLATEPLKFDLRNIFPFCIPFDIKDMLGLLSSDPVAPKYTVDWDLPFLDENFTFTVDLQGWSDVAFILRKMELLAFVIGLALVTRNLIRG